MRSNKAKLLLGSLLILIFIFIFIFFSLRKISLPEAGQQVFPGLNKPVRIERDKYGIPHIFAENETDLFFTFGRIMAKDRLFQMDIHRRVVSGRLSELFGQKTFEIDKKFRNFRFSKWSREHYQKYKNKYNYQVISNIKSFVAGINWYIENRPKPLEYYFLNSSPEKFEIFDVLAFPGYMAYSFADAFKYKPLFSKKAALFQKNPDKYNQLRFGDNEPLEITTEGPITSNFPFNRRLDILQSFNKIAAEVEGYIPPIIGSNSWVLSGQRTQSGKPILANDPHIGISFPSIFYEAYLHAPTYEVYGNFIPLMPFPVIGHNSHHGWAITMSKHADMDFYREKLDGPDLNFTIHGNRKEKFPINTYFENIKIKNKKSQSIKIRVSKHGPLLDHILPQTASDEAIALKWTYYHKDNFLYNGLYQLPKVKGPKEFEKSLRLIAAPGMNLSYADTKGNIFWTIVGKIPMRKKGLLFSDKILDGQSGLDEYLGYFSANEYPSILNPPSGAIITANHIPLKNIIAFAGTWETEERQKRLELLLAQNKSWTIDELKKVQTDYTQFSGPKLLKELLIDISSEQMSNEQRWLIKRLKNWDGQTHIQSISPTFYRFWLTELTLAVLSEFASGDELHSFCQLPQAWSFMKRLIRNSNNIWWQGQKLKMVNEAFHRAYQRLEVKFGTNPKLWNWGKLHRLTFKHSLGKVWPLSLLFNRGPFPASGGQHLVNNLKSKSCRFNLDIYTGPATRRLIDFAQPEKSLGVLPGGISGQLGSDNYDDQIPLYLNNEYRDQLFHGGHLRSNDEKQQAGTLILLPRS